MSLGEAFYLFYGLYNTVHFEVSSNDQSTFLQYDIKYKDLVWQIINLAACSINSIFINTVISM